MTDTKTRAVKPTLANLRRRAEQLGGCLDVRRFGSVTDINIDAPEGYTWDCDDLHCLVCRWDSAFRGDREQAIEDALDRISHGVSRCDLGKKCDSGCDAYWQQQETKGGVEWK